MSRRSGGLAVKIQSMRLHEKLTVMHRGRNGVKGPFTTEICYAIAILVYGVNRNRNYKNGCTAHS